MISFEDTSREPLLIDSCLEHLESTLVELLVLPCFAVGFPLYSGGCLSSWHAYHHYFFGTPHFLFFVVNGLRPNQFGVVVPLGGLNAVKAPRYPSLSVHFPQSGKAYNIPTQVDVRLHYPLLGNLEESYQYYCITLTQLVPNAIRM